MTTLETKQYVSADLESDQRWTAVEKIAESAGFRRSPRLRDFLLYVTAQQLNGRPEEITEQIVGHRVYNRGEHYNPVDDNIVRVSARQLRLKLREYYESDGRCDAWIVEIPKGGYVPLFRRRDPACFREEFSPPPEDPAQPLSSSSPVVSPSVVSSNAATSRLPLWLAIAAILVAAGLWMGTLHNRSLQAPASSAPNLVTDLFRNAPGPVNVVVSDSGFALMQAIHHRNITLDEYADQSYRRLPPDSTLDAGTRDAWNALSSRQLVNLGDVGATNQFGKALAASGNVSGVIMSSAQDKTARDFRSGNFILLGDSSSNPWVQLFSGNNYGYRFVESPLHGLAILNTRPLPGEPSLYSEAADSNQGFARIAVVSNLTGTGRVLLIAGTSMEFTEAATNFCLNNHASDLLLRRLGVDHGGSIPSFEALLKTFRESGTGLKAELIGVRLLNPEQ